MAELDVRLVWTSMVFAFGGSGGEATGRECERDGCFG